MRQTEHSPAGQSDPRVPAGSSRSRSTSLASSLRRFGFLSVLDRYIIKRFVFTFLFILFIFLTISIVIDLTERLEVFLNNKIGFVSVLTDYYAGFVPWIAALLAPFFVFLAVIWVASRMTYTYEMGSILGSGISFGRMIVPFMTAAALLSTMMWYSNHYLVPKANLKRLTFDSEYITHWNTDFQRIEFTTRKSPESEVIVSILLYKTRQEEGNHFSLKEIRKSNMTSVLTATRIKWNKEDQRWTINNYENWFIDDDGERLRKGKELDTALGFTPADLVFKIETKEGMTTPALNEFIRVQKLRGSEKIPFYQVEKHQRTSNAFSIFILTLMGVAVSMRRVRGGRYWAFAFGIAMSAVFFLTMRFSTTFATNAGLHPIIACWLPNAVFAVLAVIMLRVAPK